MDVLYRSARSRQARFGAAAALANAARLIWGHRDMVEE